MYQVQCARFHAGRSAGAEKNFTPRRQGAKKTQQIGIAGLALSLRLGGFA
jgi:hypothetical protein